VLRCIDNTKTTLLWCYDVLTALRPLRFGVNGVLTTLRPLLSPLQNRTHAHTHTYSHTYIYVYTYLQAYTKYFEHSVATHIFQSHVDCLSVFSSLWL